jgi:hypothetical protein
MNNEIASILRLNGWAGRVVLLVYGIGTTFVAVLNLGGMIYPSLGLIAIALLWAGLTMLGLSRAEPLPILWTVGIIEVVVVTTAISSWNIVDPKNAHYATWPLGAMTFLLFVLALRGRRGFAWIGFASLALVSVLVAIIAHLELGAVISDLLRQSATLVIGTLFAIALRRATSTITSIQSSQLSRVAVAAATETATREREAQNTRLEQDARPALEKIISTQPFTAQDLQEFAALAATLRGGVQPAGSSGTSIAEAVRSARMRGLGVALIDDRWTPLGEADRKRVEAALLPLLANTSQGTITVRLSPDDREEIAVIVVEENDVYRRVIVNGGVTAGDVMGDEPQVPAQQPQF